MAAAPVITWVAGVGAAAGTAVAGAVGATAVSAFAAVGSAVAVGVVSGAIIGAATAVISGGDIFEGAMKGALIGGLSAGVFSGLGIASGAASFSAESQLANYGLSASGAPLSATNPAIIPGRASTDPTGMSMTGGGTINPELANATPGLLGGKTPTPETSSGLSDGTAKILAGIGQGAAEGLGEQKAAEAKVEGQKELAEYEAQQEQLKVASNIPGGFAGRTANIIIPDHWGYQTENIGILAGGAKNA